MLFSDPEHTTDLTLKKPDNLQLHPDPSSLSKRSVNREHNSDPVKTTTPLIGVENVPALWTSILSLSPCLSLGKAL